jgi:hypothetical protein
MMAADKSYARLGLFVVLGVIVMLATGLFFIQQIRSREVITLVTYITENVSGLDISSPVRFRGVPIGRVSDLRVDAGGNASTIEVTFEVFQERLASIGGNVQRIQQLAELLKLLGCKTLDSVQIVNCRERSCGDDFPGDLGADNSDRRQRFLVGRVQVEPRSFCRRGRRRWAGIPRSLVFGRKRNESDNAGQQRTGGSNGKKKVHGSSWCWSH